MCRNRRGKSPAFSFIRREAHYHHHLPAPQEQA
jgi:hypothetical protein